MPKKIDKRYLKKLNHYWNKMEKYFIQNLDKLDINSWFDMHHIHTDWEGKGNKNLVNKKNSIKLAYKCLHYTEQFSKKYPKPIQTWLFIHENSFENAIYFHSKNENHTMYPYDFENSNTTWNSTENTFLNCIVNISIHKIGKLTNQFGTIYIVTKI